MAALPRPRLRPAFHPACRCSRVRTILASDPVRSPSLQTPPNDRPDFSVTAAAPSPSRRALRRCTWLCGISGAPSQLAAPVALPSVAPAPDFRQAAPPDGPDAATCLTQLVEQQRQPHGVGRPEDAPVPHIMPGGALFLRFLGVPVRPRQDATQRRRPREQLHAAASPPADGGAGVEQAPHAGAHEAEDAVAAAKQAGVPVPGTLGRGRGAERQRATGGSCSRPSPCTARLGGGAAGRPPPGTPARHAAAPAGAHRGGAGGGAWGWDGRRRGIGPAAAWPGTTLQPVHTPPQGSPPLPLPPVQCRQLQVGSLAELQDLMNCVLLSETVVQGSLGRAGAALGQPRQRSCGKGVCLARRQAARHSGPAALAHAHAQRRHHPHASTHNRPPNCAPPDCGPPAARGGGYDQRHQSRVPAPARHAAVGAGAGPAAGGRAHAWAAPSRPATWHRARAALQLPSRPPPRAVAVGAAARCATASCWPSRATPCMWRSWAQSCRATTPPTWPSLRRWVLGLAE